MGEAIGPAEGRDHTRRQARATSRRQPALWLDGQRMESVAVDDERSVGTRTAFRAVARQGGHD